METEIKRIVSLLEQTFERGAWHGPSVKEALENISEAQALKRLPDTHSIIELVAHMTSWRMYVVRKLAGDESYKVKEEDNFPTSSDWSACLLNLSESQRQLIAGLLSSTEGKLYQQVPGQKGPLTFYTLLHSIIHHDLYHAGQIILIKKATATQSI